MSERVGERHRERHLDKDRDQRKRDSEAAIRQTLRDQRKRDRGTGTHSKQHVKGHSWREV